MVDPQLETAAPAPDIFEQYAAMPKPPLVRMDRSRAFAEVHGDFQASDPLANVFFFQEHLPYSSQGILLWQNPIVQNDEALKKKAAKLMRRALKMKQQEPEDEEDDDDDDYYEEDREPDEEDYGPAPVNLTAWAAGEQQIQWQDVSNAIARKFFKRCVNKRDAIELLVEKGVISVAALSKANRKLLESD